MAALQLPIIVYIIRKRWLIHAAAARALMLGNVILSVPVHVRDSLLGILGDAWMYPLGRFPTEFQARLSSHTAGVYIREVTISLLEEKMLKSKNKSKVKLGPEKED